MQKDTILYVLSDTHCGHKLGLMNPETKLFDEGTGKEYTPTPTGFQLFLWDLFEYSIEELKRISKNKEIVIIVLGDITNGNRHIEQSISTRIADQIEIAKQSMKPLFGIKNIKAIRMVFGTGSHELGEGSSMLILKNGISNENSKIDIRVITHGLLRIKNKLIDYSHHGPGTGSRDWLSGNEVRFYLRNIIYKEKKSNNEIPDLFLRGHVHSFAHESIYRLENDDLVKSSITILPSMCGMGEFARQISRSSHLLSTGIVMYSIDGTISDPIPVIRNLDVRIKEEL